MSIKYRATLYFTYIMWRNVPSENTLDTEEEAEAWIKQETKLINDNGNCSFKHSKEYTIEEIEETYHNNSSKNSTTSI